MFLQPVHRGEKRALVDLQHISGYQPNSLRNPVAVDGANLHNLEDEQVEGSSQKVCFLRSHFSPLKDVTT